MTTWFEAFLFGVGIMAVSGAFAGLVILVIIEPIHPAHVKRTQEILRQQQAEEDEERYLRERLFTDACPSGSWLSIDAYPHWRD